MTSTNENGGKGNTSHLSSADCLLQRLLFFKFSLTHVLALQLFLTGWRRRREEKRRKNRIEKKREEKRRTQRVKACVCLAWRWERPFEWLATAASQHIGSGWGWICCCLCAQTWSSRLLDQESVRADSNAFVRLCRARVGVHAFKAKLKTAFQIYFRDRWEFRWKI